MTNSPFSSSLESEDSRQSLFLLLARSVPSVLPVRSCVTLHLPGTSSPPRAKGGVGWIASSLLTDGETEA